MTAIAEDTLTAGGTRWEAAPEHRDVLLGPDGLRLAEWLAAGQARVVKHGPHRTVYRVRLPEIDCHVKHCRVHDGRAWLRECLRPPKARGEYDRCLAVAARGVATVTPLAVGEARGPRPGDSFLVTQTLDAEPLGIFIEQTLPTFEEPRRTRLRQRLAVALGRFLAHMHCTGVIHDDLHANNLMVALRDDDEPQLYVLDLHAVRLGPPPGWRARRDNLVLLNRWFVLRVGLVDRLRFWKAYGAASCLPSPPLRGRGAGGEGDGLHCACEFYTPPAPHPRPLAPEYRGEGRTVAAGLQVWRARARELEEHTWQSNLRFWKARDRRCLEDNRHYRRVRSAVASGHAVSDLDTAVLDALLADPDELFRRPGAVLLKDGRSSTVAAFDLPTDGTPRPVIWKRFRVTSAADPWVALVRRTAVLRSWVFGHGLRARCLPTPRPLLVLHRRRHGLAREGYLLVEKVPDCEELSHHVAGLGTLSAEVRRQRLRSLIEQLARLVRELHARHLAQRDLKAANVLVQPTASGPTLWLIDLVGISRPRILSRCRRVQNIARLHASFRNHPLLTRTDRLRFLRTYLRWALHGKQGWKSWWRDIDRATHKKVIKNSRSGRVLS
jgi:tRNA A-37 threonylcarbamoyl transferase component Bud32